MWGWLVHVAQLAAQHNIAEMFSDSGGEGKREMVYTYLSSVADGDELYDALRAQPAPAGLPPADEVELLEAPEAIAMAEAEIAADEARQMVAADRALAASPDVGPDRLTYEEPSGDGGPPARVPAGCVIEDAVYMLPAADHEPTEYVIEEAVYRLPAADHEPTDRELKLAALAREQAQGPPTTAAPTTALMTEEEAELTAALGRLAQRLAEDAASHPEP